MAKMLKYYKVIYLRSGRPGEFHGLNVIRRSFLMRGEYDEFICELEADDQVEGFIKSTQTYNR